MAAMPYVTQRSDKIGGGVRAGNLGEIELRHLE